MPRGRPIKRKNDPKPDAATPTVSNTETAATDSSADHHGLTEEQKAKRGRPRTRLAKVEEEAPVVIGEPGTNSQKGRKICSSCKKEKNILNFYASNSLLFSGDKRVPICKDCVRKLCIDEATGILSEIELNKVCRLIDKPFYKDSLAYAYDQFAKEHSYIDKHAVATYGSEILGLYFKNIGLRQDRNRSYADSEHDGFMHQSNNMTNEERERILARYSDVTQVTPDGREEIHIPVGEFEVTPEIIELFGDGFTRIEYKKMIDKYEKLKINYTLQTNIHQESLATYVRFKVKEEMATAAGNVDEAKKWYSAAQDAAASGKLTPKALSVTDLQQGMNSVSELFKAVEQAVDVVKILPRFKYRPNDAPDFTIMCYINYERNLNGQPEVPYEDIYAFYDRKRQEYIDQNGDPYGLFDNEPTLNNRDIVEKFIKLPDEYEELVGDDDDG